MPATFANSTDMFAFANIILARSPLSSNDCAAALAVNWPMVTEAVPMLASNTCIWPACIPALDNSVVILVVTIPRLASNTCTRLFAPMI